MGERMYQKALTFSYDDGIVQDKRLLELLNRYGLKATFNLNTGIQTEDSNFEINGIRICRMEQQGLDELYQGHEIAVHGLTHAGLPEMSESEIEYEIGQDVKNIQKYYGNVPVGMAYAYGAYDDKVVEQLKKLGIRYARTVESSHSFDIPDDLLRLKPTCHHDDERLFSLAEEFLEAEPEPGQQMLFYVWGHSYEFDVNDNWDRMEKLCQMLSGEKDIFYGTNAQCLQLFGVL